MDEISDLYKIRNFLNRKKGHIISKLDNLEIVEEEKKVSPDLNLWNITLPDKYVPNKNNFSKEDFSEFELAIKRAEYYSERLIGIALNEYIEKKVGYERSVEDIIKNNLVVDKDFCFVELEKPVKINWETYALPNFLDKPLLGKKVHFIFSVYGKNHSALKSSIEYKVIHKRDFPFEPLFLIKDTKSKIFSTDVIDFLKEQKRRGHSIGYNHFS